jgi:hypothetical protein
MLPPQLRGQAITGVIAIRRARLRRGAPLQAECAGALAADRYPGQAGDPGAGGV